MHGKQWSVDQAQALCPVKALYRLFTSLETRDILKHILHATNFRHANVKFDETKPSMLPKRLIDVDHAKRSLGWRAETPLNAGIQKTVDWYVDQFSVSAPEDSK